MGSRIKIGLALDSEDMDIESVIDLLADRLADRLRSQQDGDAPAPSSPYMTVEEAADYLRCKPQRIYDLLSQGRLTPVKDGRRTLVERSEIERYLRGEPTGRDATRLPPPHETRSTSWLDR